MPVAISPTPRPPAATPTPRSEVARAVLGLPSTGYGHDDGWLSWRMVLGSVFALGGFALLFVGLYKQSRQEKTGAGP